MKEFPFVSIIIPCLDEIEFIGMCLDSIVANDYPKEKIEIFVVDGMSVDGTRKVIEEYVQKYKFIQLINNLKRIHSAALNMAIAHAKGDIVMRMDMHSTYEVSYISKCVQALELHNADNVGGIWDIVPRTDSFLGRSIAKSLSHVFGVGNAYYRFPVGEKERWVDTVPYFCVKRGTIDRVGPFNEKLDRSQDMDFNSRLKNLGGRILLVRDIVSKYHARSDMKSFLKHNWCNGVWAILPFLYSRGIPVAWRHLVPLLFTLSLLMSIGMAMLSWPLGREILFLLVVFYGILNLAAALTIALKQQELRYLATMPFVFTCLHLSYGLGSLWGLIFPMISYVGGKIFGDMSDV